VEGEVFVELLRGSPAFAQAVGRQLRSRQGIFAPYERFMAELQHGVSNNHIHLRGLLPHYEALCPALHRHVGEVERLDLEALMYAVRRLPTRITQTLALFLTDEMPELYASPELELSEVPSASRRRTVVELLPGKSMVVLRDGLSDLADFMSCLCALVYEARKLRRRLSHPATLAALGRHVREAEAACPALPFTAEEEAGLRAVWGEATAQRLFEIALHHEDYGIEIAQQVELLNARHGERWIQQIAAATRELLGVDPSELPEELPVHIISSNTHSVRNCLNPWFASAREEVLAWAAASQPELFVAEWATAQDLLYAAARGYLAAHPEAREAFNAAERGAGQVRLDRSAFTGIVVDLVDTSRLRGLSLDPALGEVGGERSLIVNIDYAFGQQAEEILGSLLMLFGRRVRSVSVLGKAGSMAGRRGDLMVAEAFVEQSTDLLYDVPRGQARVDVERLRRLAPGREIAVGPLLTVAGTLLQNVTLLRFYERIWQCVGLEMEGCYYLRQVVRAQRLGVVGAEVDLRFIYYVSDVPLQPGETLSGPLEVHEGLPPLYAATREVLLGVLGG
jgi:hypothetical protein